MEKTELRIGNLIWHIGLGEAKIIEIRRDGITICNPKNEEEFKFEPNERLYRIEPIPLTEEWLLKFGFVFLSDIGVYKLKFTIDTQVGDFEFAGVPKSISFISNGLFASGYIQHVHQLQNLYFALTGEELTLKD